MAASGDTLLEALLARLDRDSYTNPDTGEPWNAHVILTLDDGTVLRGILIPKVRFNELNTAGVVQSRFDGDPSGSWPPGVSAPDSDDQTYAYLDEVEFLSGGDWVHGCTLRVSTVIVKCCGERSNRT